MNKTRCHVGDVSKTAEGIVFLKVTCKDEEISKSQMTEVVNAIDIIAGKPSPLLVDVNLTHSLSFDALVGMTKAVNVAAVALYASNERSQLMAEYVEQFQKWFKSSPYPFRVFADMNAAKDWLLNYC